MPNWCENTLAVAGPPDELKKFRDAVKGESTLLSLAACVPQPDGLYDQKVPASGLPDWYDWCVKHWGTKWDITADVFDEGDNYAIYSFESAWSPPLPVTHKLIEDYPQLVFVHSWIEQGMGVEGKLKGAGGSVTSDYEGDFKSPTDEALEDVQALSKTLTEVPEHNLPKARRKDGLLD